MNQSTDQNNEEQSIHCRRAAELISQELEGPLSEQDQFLLKAHLSICKACSTYKDQTNLLDRTFSNLPDDIAIVETDQLAPDALQNLKDLINKNK